MGDILNFLWFVGMKFKSKFKENRVDLYCNYIMQIKNIQWKNLPALPNQAYIPTTVEHIANMLTHAACVVPATLGARTLIQRSLSEPQINAATVYGLALCLLFLVSTAFHLFCYRRKDCCMKNFLHRCDRAMIYIFIAGSYYPWLTILPTSCELVSQLRWAIWMLASIGILYQQVFHEQYKKLELLFYLIMGLGPAFIIVWSNHEVPAMQELKLGGMLYLIGVFFFKMDGTIPFAHAIWHIFVALAACVHYLAILQNLFPVIIESQ